MNNNKRFQKLTRGGSEYRIYASEDTECGHIHGAIKSLTSRKWVSHTWFSNGRVSNFMETSTDLLPEKRRRFKTNEELINSGYAEVIFRSDVIIIRDDKIASSTAYRRYLTETIEQYAHQGWLDVFTVEEQ